MNEAQITEKVIALITPYVKNTEALNIGHGVCLSL